jgi:GDPmannose 4,6-dehydratase
VARARKKGNRAKGVVHRTGLPRLRAREVGETMKALVLGASGQDGSYLCELLLDKGYETHGTIRRSSSFNTGRINHIFDKLHLHYSDSTDGSALGALLAKVKPDEIYSLSAQSHVRVSFDIPCYTADSIAMGTLRLLEAARAHCPEARIYNAGSSEMFGSTPAPQNENSLFHPRSPYGCAKVFAHNICVNYREAYGMFIANGMLFNHDSPRRGETFVTQKIVKAAAKIKLGQQDILLLGNLDARRDIGYAPEYVSAMYLMIQQAVPDDFVIATGETHSIREMLDVVFSHFNLEWDRYVRIDSKYLRPTEVEVLQGDSSKAKRVLGWEAKTGWKDLLILMAEHALGGLR